MDNAEPVEILYWVLTPQVGYNYVTALATYSKEPFIVQPSPFIPKNLQAKDNGDGTYTFSWDKVELDTVKQYSLEVVDPSGNGVLYRYNLTTNSVTEPVQFLFSGRAAMKVSPKNSWGSTMGMAYDTAFVYNVPDNRDGLEIKWAVAPRQPHYLKEVEAPQRVILHKSQILLSSLKTLTTDSIHYRLSWACNTDTVQYQLQLRSGGYLYTDQQLSQKQFDFTALSGYTNYSWAIRAVTATGEPLTTWYDSEPFYAKRSLRMVSNLQGSASGKTLRFTWNTNAERVRAELWVEYDTWRREPVFPKGDSIITDKSFSITVKEDARYHFLLYAQVKDDQGNWVDVYEENGMYLNVFNDVKTYTVNVSATTGGNFWGMNPSGDYPEGYELMLRPSAEEGYRFVKWSDGDFNITRTFTITKNMSFTAEFAEASTPLAKYAVQILSNDVQLGEVGQVSGTYTEGDKLTLTATPKEGAEFVQWSDGNKEATRVITIASDTTIIAYFQYKRVTITVNAAAGGTVNAEEINGTYNYGTIVTLIATPDEHYHFIGWSDGSTENNRMITLKEDMTITANFAKQQYLITFLNADGSYIESNSWNYGDIPSCTVTPTMDPDEQWNYIFAGWTPEIKAVTGNAIYTAVYTKDPNPGQAIDTVQGNKVQGLKVMENGILYIQYNGMKYNVMGNRVK